MGCESSQPVVANAAKNEVDLQLERLHEEERTHYKVGLVGYEASTTSCRTREGSIYFMCAGNKTRRKRAVLFVACSRRATHAKAKRFARCRGMCVSLSLSPADLLG